MNQSSSRASLIFGLLLVLLGFLFLIGQVFQINFGAFLWPFIVIIIGLMFFVGMLVGGRSTGGLAIPGSIITGIGLILFFQNATGAWQTWAYAWTLILAFIGVGLVILGRWSGQKGPIQSGWGLIRVGLVLFLIFGAFFELAIGLSGMTSARILWPLFLILFGLFLLLRQTGLFSRKVTYVQPPAPPPAVIITPELDQPAQPPAPPPAEIITPELDQPVQPGAQVYESQSKPEEDSDG